MRFIAYPLNAKNGFASRVSEPVVFESVTDFIRWGDETLWRDSRPERLRRRVIHRTTPTSVCSLKFLCDTRLGWSMELPSFLELRYQQAVNLPTERVTVWSVRRLN